MLIYRYVLSSVIEHVATLLTCSGIVLLCKDLVIVCIFYVVREIRCSLVLMWHGMISRKVESNEFVINIIIKFYYRSNTKQEYI